MMTTMKMVETMMMRNNPIVDQSLWRIKSFASKLQPICIDTYYVCSGMSQHLTVCDNNAGEISLVRRDPQHQADSHHSC